MSPSFRRLIVHSPCAEVVHGIDQSDDILDRSFRQHAMAEIEDMPRAPRRPPQNLLGAASDLIWRREQSYRIQIALHGYIVADRRPTLVQVYAPVQADDIAARCADHFQGSGSAGTEIDYRRGSAVRLLGVSASALQSSGWQEPLFQRDRRNSLAKLYSGIDELRKKFGDEVVGAATPRNRLG